MDDVAVTSPVIPRFGFCDDCRRSVDECKFKAMDYTDADGNICPIRRCNYNFTCQVCKVSNAYDANADVCCVCNNSSCATLAVTCQECGNKAYALQELVEISSEYCCDSCFMEDRTFIVRPNGSDAIVCFECYILFLIDQIENRDLVLTQDAQSFTIAGCVNKTHGVHVDPHILRLVGTSLYRKCMRFCAENLVIFLDNGRICPLPGCGEAILGVPDVSVQQVIACPHCRRQFCQHCKTEAFSWECPQVVESELARVRLLHSEDAQRKRREAEGVGRSLSIAKKTSKACPKCGIVLTHFYGDACHHIGYLIGGCPGCKAEGRTFHWCYFCLKGGSTYPQSCKNDHWFCKAPSQKVCDCPPCPTCNKVEADGITIKGGKPIKKCCGTGRHPGE